MIFRAKNEKLIKRLDALQPKVQRRKPGSSKIELPEAVSSKPLKTKSPVYSDSESSQDSQVFLFRSAKGKKKMAKEATNKKSFSGTGLQVAAAVKAKKATEREPFRPDFSHASNGETSKKTSDGWLSCKTVRDQLKVVPSRADKSKKKTPTPRLVKIPSAASTSSTMAKDLLHDIATKSPLNRVTSQTPLAISPSPPQRNKLNVDEEKAAPEIKIKTEAKTRAKTESLEDGPKMKRQKCYESDPDLFKSDNDDDIFLVSPDPEANDPIVIGDTLVEEITPHHATTHL